MAKKRTRQQKAKTIQRRGSVLAPAVPVVQERLVVPNATLFTSSPVEKSEQIATPPEHQSLLRVDRAYLKADIRRSLLISIVLCAVLIGIFWLVRYNGLIGTTVAV